MTVSNSTSWELTGNEIVQAALRKIQALAKGQTPDSEDLSYGLQALNSLISFYTTKGLRMLTRYTLTTPLVEDLGNMPLPETADIIGVYLTSKSGNSQYPLNSTPYNDFMYFSPSSKGTPTAYTLGENLEGKIVYVWPKPDAIVADQYDITFVLQRKSFFVTDGTQTVDFQAYWELALIYNLAVLLAPEYGTPLQDIAALQAMAAKFEQEAMDFSDENQSLFAHPTIKE